MFLEISEDLDAIKPNELKAHVERASVLFSKGFSLKLFIFFSSKF